MSTKQESAMRQALEWIEDATAVLSHTSTAIQGGLGAEAEGVGGCSVKVLKDLREALAEQATKPDWKSEATALRVNEQNLEARLAAEPVAWCLGDPAKADSSNVFLAHEFTPSGEHENEWTPLCKCTPAPTQQPLTDEQAALAAEAVDQIMEQAQVFASAWSLVGGRFDDGDGMENADAEKAELRTMVTSLARLTAQSVKEGGAA